MGETTLKVRLLSHTPDAEQTVAMAARLCYSNDDIEAIQQGVETKDQSKYLSRLIDMGHLSPIEHASYTFGVEGVSRSLLAQLTRHRIASFSVKSQRYVGSVSDDGKTFNYIVPPSIKALGPEAEAEFAAQMAQMQQWYDHWTELLEESGKAYEDARFVLPNAAETKIIFTMNARELMHFFNLRCCNRAQWEIREMAWQMLALVKKETPLLFKNAGPICVSGVCREGKMACGQILAVRAKYQELFGE